MKTNLWLILAAVLSSSVAVPAMPGPDAPADAAPAAPAAVPGAAVPKKSAAPKPAATAASESPAAALPPGPAKVKENVRGVVNVRGKASITGDVVAQLKPGEPVQVLDEVTLKNPKTDEPARWAKIALPANAQAWVYSEYVDPASKVIKANRLNIRSGPGENYSVIGRIEKGTPVHDLETKGNWLRIEPPKDAYAFVAAHLLTPEVAPPAVAAAEPPKPETPAATPPPAPPVTETVIPPATTPAPAQEPQPAEATPPPTPEPAPAIAAAPTPPPTVTPEPGQPAPVEAAEPPIIEEPKRVVTREGIVRRSVSIQAPAYFVLESLDNGRAVNYLFSTNIALRDYRGRRIVVTGEEVLDERWPNTPVISVDRTNSINVVP